MKTLLFSLIITLLFVSQTTFANTTGIPSDLTIIKTYTVPGTYTIRTDYSDGSFLTIMPNQPNPSITTYIKPDGSRYNLSPEGVLTQTVPPRTTQTNTTTIKTPTNIATLDQIVDPSRFGGQPLNNILNQLFWVGLVAAVVLALVMIIRGGIEYMTVDSVSGKEGGKSKVQAALGGLLLAFAAILILNTINPGLTKLSIVFEQLKQIRKTDIEGGLTSSSRDPITGEIIPIGGPVSANFRDEAIKQYALDKIKAAGLSSLSPRDKAAFFPNGGTDEEWLALVSAMATLESGQSSGKTYRENFTNDAGEITISTGLLQLSYESVRNYKGYNSSLANITTEDLKNPQVNIDAGVTILKRLVERDGCISCVKPDGSYGGGAAYWSVLRPTGKLTEVKQEMLKTN